MNIRGRNVNLWKWAVLAWGAHKAMKAGRAFYTQSASPKKRCVASWKIATPIYNEILQG